MQPSLHAPHVLPSRVLMHGRTRWPAQSLPAVTSWLGPSLYTAWATKVAARPALRCGERFATYLSLAALPPALHRRWRSQGDASILCPLQAQVATAAAAAAHSVEARASAV